MSLSFIFSSQTPCCTSARNRARNIKLYIRSMSPQEFPLKPGQWKSFQRKIKDAEEDARNRVPCKPGEKPHVRKRKVSS